MKVGKLTFKELALDGKRFISTDVSDQEKRGIYAYEFDDGEWYVGKSEDVRKRHAQHMAEYRHYDPVWNPVKMLWMPVAQSENLDNTETVAIAAFEGMGCSLKNIQKANRPRGNNAVKVVIDGKFGVEIPWERDNLPSSTKRYRIEHNEKMRAKFERLKKREDYKDILAAMAKYVRKTIPAPEDTAGKLWVATAYPSTMGRICCISCQNVQTMIVLQGEKFGVIGTAFVLGVKPAGEFLLPHPELVSYWSLSATNYKNLPNGFEYMFESDIIGRALQSQLMLDCCYRANAELMRKGPAMFNAHNNPYLVDAILKCKDFDTAEFKDPLAITVSKEYMQGVRTEESMQFGVAIKPRNLKWIRG